MYKELVQNVIESCKNDNSYVVMLKTSKLKETQQKLDEKCTLVHSVNNIINRYKYKEYEFSFYITGKLMIKNVKNIEQFLEDVLS